MINYRNGREYIKCSIESCTETTSSVHGLCCAHYKQRWYLNSQGRTEKIERKSQRHWINYQTGYMMVKAGGKLVYEHRVLAEKALGRPLPEGAVVHHTGSPSDNHGYFKLVICPSQDYHLLLHRRMEECGL